MKLLLSLFVFFLTAPSFAANCGDKAGLSLATQLEVAYPFRDLSKYIEANDDMNYGEVGEGDVSRRYHQILYSVIRDNKIYEAMSATARMPFSKAGYALRVRSNSESILIQWEKGSKKGAFSFEKETPLESMSDRIAEDPEIFRQAYGTMLINEMFQGPYGDVNLDAFHLLAGLALRGPVVAGAVSFDSYPQFLAELDQYRFRGLMRLLPLKKLESRLATVARRVPTERRWNDDDYSVKVLKSGVIVLTSPSVTQRFTVREGQITIEGKVDRGDAGDLPPEFTIVIEDGVATTSDQIALEAAGRIVFDILLTLKELGVSWKP